MCFKNNLDFYETEADLKKKGEWLTNLEGAMIARKIIFMKIFLLPTSRWTGLKDKAVNIPVPESAVLNTIDLLPRTPLDAGLISVTLKRKKEYNNSHHSQLIDPKKIFAVLEKLKKHRNPYYTFYDDYMCFEKKVP